MIGVDTNILVRFFTQDDAPQARMVNAFLAKAQQDGEMVFIDDVVLCELVWVLDDVYHFDRAAVADVVEKSLSSSVFAFADRVRLRQTLIEYRGGKADFADYLIGGRNLAEGCSHTVTFDRALRSSSSFMLL